MVEGEGIEEEAANTKGKRMKVMKRARYPENSEGGSGVMLQDLIQKSLSPEEGLRPDYIISIEFPIMNYTTL